MWPFLTILFSPSVALHVPTTRILLSPVEVCLCPTWIPEKLQARGQKRDSICRSEYSKHHLDRQSKSNGPDLPPSFVGAMEGRGDVRSHV